VLAQELEEVELPLKAVLAAVNGTHKEDLAQHVNESLVSEIAYRVFETCGLSLVVQL